ncbi:uncharacterized protein V6R79_005141 [Siganus canaliculatus]
MERSSNYCTLGPRITFLILVLFPVRSWCNEDTYQPLTETRPECRVGGDAEFKRFEDIDDDSFVSLMGRRSASLPKIDMSHVLAALLGQRTRNPFPYADGDSQARRSVHRSNQSFQGVARAVLNLAPFTQVSVLPVGEHATPPRVQLKAGKTSSNCRRNQRGGEKALNHVLMFSSVLM